MKLSFSTLGCPSWSFDEILTTAKDLALEGVEIRGVGKELYAPAIPEFLPENIGRTRERLDKIGLCISCLTSGEVLAEPDPDGETARRAMEYIRLASALGVRYVRVMGTGEPQATAGDFDLAALSYARLCEAAEPLGVVPLIETNGALASSGFLLSFLDKAGAGNAGVLWDVHHTVRFGSEEPGRTADALGALIRHVHVKDSVSQDGKIAYRMLGHGTVPVEETVEALRGIGYGGFVSLEWVKRWNPGLQEPGIVFAHFKSYMDSIL